MGPNPIARSIQPKRLVLDKIPPYIGGIFVFCQIRPLFFWVLVRLPLVGSQNWRSRNSGHAGRWRDAEK
ncbi:MAG: hypothetical protein WCP19_14155 [Chloroflexota bacterium]